MASIDSSVLSTSLAGGQQTIRDVSASAGIIALNKEAFFKRITWGSTRSINHRTGRYNGSLILKAEDLLNLLNLPATTLSDCVALHCSFSYKRGDSNGNNVKNPMDMTDLVFQKIIQNAAGNLILDTTIFSTERLIIPTPDPLFHCPGPCCTP
jgi:hypothetical protein